MDKLRVEAYFSSVDEKLSVYSSDPEDNNSEHCHDFDELVIVDSGHGLHVINGKPVFIQEGDVFFVRDNDYHFYDELGTLKLINVLGYLQEHCFTEINWVDVADEFLLTQRTLFRRIKETTGMTPENYLKRLRLVSARVKIKNTETSITDIAFMCGFSNSNHFTTSYKQVFGITPSQERKKA